MTRIARSLGRAARALHRLAIRPAPSAPSPAHLIDAAAHRTALEAVRLFMSAVVKWVARTDLAALRRLWAAINSTTRPVIGGPSWHAEFVTMTVIAAAVALPLLVASAILSIARQDVSGFVRTAFVRVPLALVFTGAAVELVSLCLAATDAACHALMHSAGRPVGSLFRSYAGALRGENPDLLLTDAFMLVVSAVLCFLVWLELAVRQAAVAVATLFLPLALAGSAFPGTAHWARRLGETLAALVLSKLVIVAVLSLAASVLGTPGRGTAAVLEGVTLLALSCVAPFALARILPMVEAGAVGHLEGLGRHSAARVARSPQQVLGWLAPDGGSAGSAASGSGGASGAGAAGLATTGLAEARPPSGGTGPPPPPPGPVTPSGTVGA